MTKPVKAVTPRQGASPARAGPRVARRAARRLRADGRPLGGRRTPLRARRRGVARRSARRRGPLRLAPPSWTECPTTATDRRAGAARETACAPAPSHRRPLTEDGTSDCSAEPKERCGEHRGHHRHPETPRSAGGAPRWSSPRWPPRSCSPGAARRTGPRPRPSGRRGSAADGRPAAAGTRRLRRRRLDRRPVEPDPQGAKYRAVTKLPGGPGSAPVYRAQGRDQAADGRPGWRRRWTSPGSPLGGHDAGRSAGHEGRPGTVLQVSKSGSGAWTYLAVRHAGGTNWPRPAPPTARAATRRAPSAARRRTAAARLDRGRGSGRRVSPKKAKRRPADAEGARPGRREARREQAVTARCGW